MKTYEFDFIVLGSGVAGLRAAAELADYGQTAIITKAAIGESSSEYAQGGVAVVMSDDDDIYLHYEDTIKAGDGLCDKNAVFTLVDEGPRYINELIAQGANFDMHEGTLDFTKEAAHSVNRIIHAKGDATGHEIVRSLKNSVSKKESIKRFENVFAVDIIQDNGMVSGIFAIEENSREKVIFNAKAVILTTGGAGQIFKRTTNPPVATGDGIAIAFRAGARQKDLEFYQFHPTALTMKNAPAFLLSESMRGEGGVLKNIHGDRFCNNYHNLGELAPRDVVSRAIFSEMQKTDSEFVYLDLTDLGKDFVKNRFPKIYNTCLDFGLDITKEQIPVSPAAHYYMGGVETDLWGRTSIEGLYAAGETACTGVHGANRLASNSLLEGVVFGGRSAKAAIVDSKHKALQRNNVDYNDEINLSDKYETYLQEIQEIMWGNVGVVRNFDGLTKTISYFNKKLEMIGDKKPANQKTGEIINMFYVGKLMALAAASREGSRGAHFREDFPEKSKEDFHIIFKDGKFSPVNR